MASETAQQGRGGPPHYFPFIVFSSMEVITYFHGSKIYFNGTILSMYHGIFRRSYYVSMDLKRKSMQEVKIYLLAWKYVERSMVGKSGSSQQRLLTEASTSTSGGSCHKLPQEPTDFQYFYQLPRTPLLPPEYSLLPWK